jgi:hypothetical protein
MYNGLYLACMLSAATTATVMWWVLRQNLRALRIAADQLPQRRLRDLQHLGKAFIVVPVTVLTEQYVYSTHDFAHQIRMLEGFQWLLGHGMWAFGFILVWDWAVRKTLQTNPHRLPALQRIAALCVCLYASCRYSVYGTSSPPCLTRQRIRHMRRTSGKQRNVSLPLFKMTRHTASASLTTISTHCLCLAGRPMNCSRLASSVE